MNLFVVQYPGHPDVFIKAKNSDGVWSNYTQGFDPDTEPNRDAATIRQIDTLAELMEFVPDEFQINKDTSF